MTAPFADREPALAVSETPPSPEAVEAFLVAPPGFLAERPLLFRVLEPPRRVHGERIADHMAAMLGAERRRARVLEAEIDAAAAAGRAGQGLNFRVRLAVLALMRCTDVVETVSQELPALLGIEACALAAMMATESEGDTKKRLPRTMLRSASPSAAAPKSGTVAEEPPPCPSPGVPSRSRRLRGLSQNKQNTVPKIIEFCASPDARKMSLTCP